MTTLQTQTPSGSQALLYTQQRYFFVALDPIHIGAGGYRLGRVDMTIVREPGTQLPKIPGTNCLVQRVVMRLCVTANVMQQDNIMN